ncbi:MAG: hypothetical protein GY705_29660 [Bacteroidetes bacterium]|nr:hypothetical protein [Bacteroidota bacterium]
MKNFLKNILLFFLIYLGLSFIISICVPYHWGNPWYSVKISYLEKENDRPFNAYFFGSSKVYRQFDPTLFDSLAHAFTNEEIRSFNMGAPGTFVPQTYYLYERFLNSELSNGVKYCFLELKDVFPIRKRLMHREKTNYWLGMSDLGFATKSIFADKTKSKINKATHSTRYLTTYIENALHIGHFGGLLTTPKYYEEDFLGPFHNGYLPLEYEYKTTKNPTVREKLMMWQNAFEKEPERIDARKTMTVKAYNDSFHTFYDRVNQKRILELIDKKKKKGIELIFVLIAPEVERCRNSMINLSHNIPEPNLIDLANPTKYPDLYTVENNFDFSHLNTKGAGIFTSCFAEEFKQGIIPKRGKGN